jgi:hypothetical protein
VIETPRPTDEIFRRRPHEIDTTFNWAWPLTNIEPLVVPVPARGQQGFWEWAP